LAEGVCQHLFNVNIKTLSRLVLHGT
jgi:hypothetical protein